MNAGTLSRVTAGCRVAARSLLAAGLVLGCAPAPAQCIEALTAVDRLQVAVAADAAARDALVTVRRLAQDWKNLLLRGRDAGERRAMQQRFDAQSASYRQRLADLRGQLAALPFGLDAQAVLETEQRALDERYRAALDRRGVATLEAAADADRDAQGADVLTFRTLEQLIDALATPTRTRFQDLRDAIERCGGPISPPRPPAR